MSLSGGLRFVRVVVGAVLVLIGLPGIPEDVARWRAWLDALQAYLYKFTLADLLFLALGIALLASAIPYRSWRHLPTRLRGAPKAVSVTSSRDSDRLRWLERIADEDDRNAAHRLDGLGSYAKKFFGGPEPYLEIHVPIINTSVFDFAIDERVVGAMSWNDNSLQFPARILEPGMVIRHADQKEIVVRQHVSSETARLIDAEADPWIDTGRFKMIWTYEYKGQKKALERGIAARVRVGERHAR